MRSPAGEIDGENNWGSREVEASSMVVATIPRLAALDDDLTFGRRRELGEHHLNWWTPTPPTLLALSV
jgi:hypothetical protein